MRNYKKNLIISLTIFIVVLIIGLGYTNVFIKKEIGKKIVKEDLVAKPSAFFTEEYDYPKLLALIEQCRQLTYKLAIDYDQFLIEIENKTSVEKLLEELTKEKHLFNQYIQSLKTYTNAPLTSRRKKALRHFGVVIEDSINELEDMLERFKKLTNNDTQKSD